MSSMGTVVGFKKQRDDKHWHGHFFFPRIEFLAGGRKIDFVASSGRGIRGFAVGDTVSILYDPANPERADMATSSAMWLLPIVLAALSLPFLLVNGIRLFSRAK